MYKYVLLVGISTLLIFSLSCDFCEEETIVDDILGCTDSLANNYDPDATADDGSCDYCSDTSSFILITHDGGITWDKKCINIPTSTIIDISIVDSNNIWICTAAATIGNERAQIIHTNNDGYTWTEQYADTLGNKFFNYIEMFDEYNGIAMGDGEADVPLFLKTTDGGQNWIQTTNQPIGGLSGDTWRRVDFINPDYGFFFESGINPQKMYRTINGGYQWHETNFSDYAMVLKFYDEYLGLVIDNKVIRRTFEGGSTWQEFNLPNDFTWGLDVEFHPDDPSKVWAAFSNVYFSSDTGRTWTILRGSNVGMNSWTGPVQTDDIYVGDNTVWAIDLYAFYNDGIIFYSTVSENVWYSIPILVPESGVINGVFDGVGDQTIVIPGYILIPD